jgi:hypothetical protein
MALVTTSYSSTTDTTALTITLASLATSSSSVAGRNSTIVDNTSNKYADVIVSGQITVGTTPTTAKTISVYVYAPIKVASSTFTYPIATTTALTETDAAATFEVDQRNNMKLAAAMNVVATSDRAYSFTFSLAQLFGGVVPLKWGVWVTHDTAVNLNATAGNHWIHYTGIKYDIT